MGLDYLNSGPVLDLCYKAMYEMHTGKLLRCCLWSDSYQSEKYANDTQAPELREWTQILEFQTSSKQKQSEKWWLMHKQYVHHVCVQTAHYAYTRL